ncbi:MAG: hypothetical protein LBS20_20325 [Prevotella sp.]|jgi:hypothetical protein|nr:hypothetical protein [Prevotella sp.]
MVYYKAMGGSEDDKGQTERGVYGFNPMLFGEAGLKDRNMQISTLF